MGISICARTKEMMWMLLVTTLSLAESQGMIIMLRVVKAGYSCINMYLRSNFGMLFSSPW